MTNQFPIQRLSILFVHGYLGMGVYINGKLVKRFELNDPPLEHHKYLAGLLEGKMNMVYSYKVVSPGLNDFPEYQNKLHEKFPKDVPKFEGIPALVPKDKSHVKWIAFFTPNTLDKVYSVDQWREALKNELKRDDITYDEINNRIRDIAQVEDGWMVVEFGDQFFKKFEDFYPFVGQTYQEIKKVIRNKS